MGGQTSGKGGAQPKKRRLCVRVGCSNEVKKPTAKYCSVTCCAIDPERHERLRVQARRSKRTFLPMAHQLSWENFAEERDPEEQIAIVAAGREDVPFGMSRLAV